jgi:hypothetical protein
LETIFAVPLRGVTRASPGKTVSPTLAIRTAAACSSCTPPRDAATFQAQ